MANHLAEDYRVICPDLPGFGKSPIAKKPFSLQQIGDTIVRWLQSQDIKNTIVIGHSLGGYIALEILKNHPKFALGIGLFNSSAKADAPEKKENRDKLIQFISKHGVEPFLQTFVPSLFYPKTAKKHQKTIDEIYHAGLTILPEAVMGYATAMRDRADSMNLLDEYTNRILLIAGEYDQNVPKILSEQMASRLLPENVHILPDSAHMCMFEQPELSAMALKAFFRKIQEDLN